MNEKGDIANYDELESWKCDSCKTSNDEGQIPRYTGSFFMN